MKYAFFLSLSFLSTICFADATFRDVVSKTCDNKNVPIVAGERIYLDEKAGVLGYGFEANKCRTSDFYQLRLGTITTVNGARTIDATPHSAMARKNCRGEVSAAAPIFFSSIALRTNGNSTTFTFLGTQDCKQLVLGLR